jgi:hypothetical protein
MFSIPAFLRLVNSKTIVIFVVFITFSILLLMGNRKYKFTNFKNNKACISHDGGGYYAYLPQTFIYKTSNFQFSNNISRKYPKSDFFKPFLVQNNGSLGNKCFVGVSICMAPAFWITHQFTQLLGGDADGYSNSYQFSVFLSALLFWLLGIICIFKLLRKLNISTIIILICLIVLTFGTNLIYYIIDNPSTSHVYNFGVIAFFLFRLKIYLETRKNNNLIFLFFLLGLLTIMRPTNFLIVLIIPFFFKFFSDFWNLTKETINKKIKVIFVGILIYVCLLFFQLLNIHSQTGIWSFNSYGGGEGFDYLLNPKIPEFLFGFRKGFFVYTPIFLLIFPSLVYVYRSSWNQFIWISIFFIFYTYILASWWCWHYGGSFGMRAMIDIYPILIIPIAMMLEKLTKLLKCISFVFIGLMIQFNFLLLFQLRNSILDHSEMNRQLFFQVFLQTGERFRCVAENEPPRFDTKDFQLNSSYFYQLNQKKWVKFNTQPHEIIRNEIPCFVFIPDSTLRMSQVAIQLNFSQKLNSEMSAPKVQLFGYKNNEKEELSVDYFGSRIPRINKFYQIDSRLTSKFKYQDFDSLEVFFENHNAKVKDLSCRIFTKKK